MTPDRQLEIASQIWDVLDDPRHGTTCLYPTEPGSPYGPTLETLAAQYGEDDIDVILQSASFFVVASDDAGNWALETPGQKPWLATSAGQLVPAYQGSAFHTPNEYRATKVGWLDVDLNPNWEDHVDCFMAPC